MEEERKESLNDRHHNREARIKYSQSVSKRLNTFLPLGQDKLKYYKENRYLTPDEFRRQQREKRLTSNAIKQESLQSPSDVMNKMMKTSSSGFFNTTSKSGFNLTNANFYNPNKTNNFSVLSGLTKVDKSNNRNSKLLMNLKKLPMDHTSSNLDKTLNMSFKSVNNVSPAKENTSNAFNATSNSIKANSDFNLLLTMYEKGHKFDKKEKNQTNKIEKQEFLKKYGIESDLRRDEKDEVFNRIKSPFSNRNFDFYEKEIPSISVTNGVYKDPFKSFKKLKVNKQLQESMMRILTGEQVKQYADIIVKAEEENFKMTRMPKIKTSQQNPYKKKIQLQTFEEKVEEQLEMLNPNNPMKNVTREVLFKHYNELFVHYVKNFKNAPSARSQMTMVKHYSLNSNSYRLLLFGGISSERLNDIWTCEIKENKDVSHGIEYVWNKTKPRGDVPMPRSGHTSVMYRNEMFIFGGILEDEKIYKVKEDILIYDVIGNKFMSETCFNKNDLKWRRNHIAESVGHHMLIYGGIDEEHNILNDTWLLDYVNLRWLRIEPKGLKFPPLAYHCSCVVLTSEKKNHATFSIFKNPDIPINKLTANKLKHEGIYIFGGLDDEDKCRNEVYVIKICRKPLERLKLEINGAAPQPRIQASMDYFEGLNFILLHGGYNNHNKKGYYYNDFWLLDLENLLWFKIHTYDGVAKNTCDGRAEHSSVIHENNLIIFGGTNGKYFLGSEIMVVNLDFFDSKNKKFNHRNNILQDSNVTRIAIDREKIMSSIHKETEDKGKRSERSKSSNDPQSMFEAYIDKGDKILQKMKDLKDKNLGSNFSFGGKQI